MPETIEVLAITLTPERIAGLLWSALIDDDVIGENNKVYIDRMDLNGDELDIILRITAEEFN